MNNQYTGWTLKKYGRAQRLALNTYQHHPLKDTEILIKIEYSGVNSADIALRKGKKLIVRLFNGLFYPKKITRPGVDFSGRIISVGHKVKKYNQGDWVFGLRDNDFSTNSQYLYVDANCLMAKIPIGVSPETACAGSFGGINALFFINLLPKLENRSKILVTNAQGSVGNAVFQILNAMEHDVIAGIRTGHESSFKSQFPNVLSMPENDLRNLGSDTLDAIIDCGGRRINFGLIKALKSKGYLVTTSFGFSTMIFKYITEIFSDKKIISRVAGYYKEDLECIAEYICSGTYDPQVDSIFPYEDLIAAHKYIDNFGKFGSVVIKS